MSCLFVTHWIYRKHITPDHHPEQPGRLLAIEQALADPEFDGLIRHQPKAATAERVALAHDPGLLRELASHIPEVEGDLYWVDGDTCLSTHSLEAALHAVGGACEAVDLLFAGKARHAFCALRPPGHHATRGRAMGFCLFNNIAIAALHARRAHGVKRVAIVDFDVHHGNGTQDIFSEDADLLYASTHQYPLFPGSGAEDETGVGNLVNRPLAPGSGGAAFRAAYTDGILPRLRAFKPQLVLASAGFDGHRLDPLANLNLEVEDYVWLTRELLNLAREYADGRLIYMLEGGYHLAALADSVAAVVRELQS